MHATPETAIVAAGCAAAQYTKETAALHEESLCRLYNPAFVANAKNICSPEDMIRRILSDFPDEEEQVFETGSLGAYDTLWKIGEYFSSGLEADAYRIPILSETIEVCELTGVDPFAQPSKGLLFITTKRPAHVIKKIEALGVGAVIIGRLTQDNARIVRYGERQRYLTKPDR